MGKYLTFPTLEEFKTEFNEYFAKFEGMKFVLKRNEHGQILIQLKIGDNLIDINEICGAGRDWGTSLFMSSTKIPDFDKLEIEIHNEEE